MPEPSPSPSSPAPASAANAPARKRRWPWWKRLLVVLGAIFLLLAVLHRPLIFGAAKFAARSIGKKQGLDISFEPGGTIFTGLTLRNVRVAPTRPGAIEKANVGLAEVHYSLLDLARGGLSSRFLKAVTLHDVDVLIDPNQSPPSPPKKKEAFQLPPLPFPERLSLRNVNFALRPASKEKAQAAARDAATSSAVPAPAAPAVAGATQAVSEAGLLLAGLNLELDPAHPGELRIGELRIPGGPDLKNVVAQTTYANRDLEFTDLVLDPNLRFRRLGIDASQLDREILALRLDADAFAGRLTGAVRLQGIGKPPLAHVELDVNDLALAALHDFLNVGPALGGQLSRVTVRFDGQSDKPRTWLGRIETHLEKPAAGPAALDRVDFRVALADGKADVQTLEIAAGPTRFALTARGDLPENIADLSRSPARGTITLAAPDLQRLPIALPPTLGLRGALEANGPFTLENGRLSSEVTGRATGIVTAEPPASLREATFKTTLAKTLPADATAPASAPNTPPPPTPPFWDGLTTAISATLRDLAYENYRLDAVDLAAQNDNAAVRVERLDVTRGANQVHVAATYELPAEPNQWQTKPLNVDLLVNAPDLAGFSADLRAEPLAGKLNAKGHVATQNGVWQGGFDLQGRDIVARGLTVRTADAQVALADNAATITLGRIQFDDKNAIDAGGRVALSAPFPFNGNLAVNLSDLGAFNPVLRANGVNQTLAGSLFVKADTTGRMETAAGANDAQLDGTIVVTGRNVLAAGVRVANLDARVVARDGRAVIENGAVRFDEKNVIGLNGEVALAGSRAFDLNVNADLPNLAAFEPALRANGVNQNIAGALRLQTRLRGEAAGATAKLTDGQIVVNGSELRVNDARALQTLEGRVRIDNDVAHIENFVVKFDDKNTVNLTGQAGTAAPFDYQANVEANLTDLRSFEPLLRTFAAKTDTAANAKKPAPTLGEPAVKKKPTAPPPKPVAKGSPPARNVPTSSDETRLAGAVQLRFQSSGRGAAVGEEKPALNGNLSVSARGVEFNALGPLNADVAGSFTPTTADFGTLNATLNGLQFSSTLQLKNNLLRLDNLHLRQGSTELLGGYAQLPFDPTKLSDPAGPVPDVDLIDVNVDSKPIPLDTLYRAAFPGQAAPASGTLALTVLAKGRLSKLFADVKVAARTLRTPQTAKLAPADADVDLNFHDDRLNLDASVRQPQIAPLTLKGNVPLNLQSVLSKKSVDPKSPVTLTLSLPRTQLGFVKNLAPGIRFVEGSAQADVRVNGTIERPVLNGSIDVNMPAARAENITVPALRDLQARITFNDRTVRIERFGVVVGGGRAAADGRIDFAKLTEPTLDVSLKANDVLALRTDNITARVNADVRVAGPLNAASVTGRVGITKSRFLKDIDILPLNLPGKPAPAPPAAAQSGYGPEAIADMLPPIVRDWKFNLSLKTDDPFVIRGNLANGRALVDLALAGTGAKPLLSGYVQVENLKASLPFSRLEIQNGNIQFTADQPLNPALDLRGTSQIRERLVTVYISGRAHDPKTLFTSEPPLPQSDIVALLATGSTPSELTGNSQALAGKATLLVLQDLYRRTFKKNRSASSNADPQPTLADRVDVNLGDVDPKTGKQSVGARFKINDQFQFIGDFGVEGDLRGRIKYLLRFR